MTGKASKALDRAKPALLASLAGGALGDALGADAEFLTGPALDGWELPTDLASESMHDETADVRSDLAITDDTQMTLFTLEGIVRANYRQAARGVSDKVGVVHHALLRWLLTQGVEPSLSIDRDHGLVTLPWLHARRAPGTTCLGSLSTVRRFGDPVSNESKGCGTIMRVAPAALLVPRERVRAFAIETSALTHGHPTGQLAAAAWAEMLANVAGGRSVSEAARSAVSAYSALQDADEVVGAITRALQAPRDGGRSAVQSLGGGWVAEECLSIALYCCLCFEEQDGPAGVRLERALDLAIRHDGDSDSTAATAGNMLGLLEPALLKAASSRLPEVVEVFSKLLRSNESLMRGELDINEDGFLSTW